MNTKQIKQRFYITITLLCLFLTVAGGQAYGQGSGFTYQGRLTNAGNPADGLFDMQFKLFDTAVVGTGSQQGPTITNPSVQVTNAVFTVQLDFGAGVFTGEPRFLEIGVRSAGSADPHTILSPRQPLTAIPYAVRSATATTALNATQLEGQPASGFIQNTTSQQAGTNFNIGGNGTVGGTLTANTAIVNGNMGIGIASPTERLHVAGNGLFTGSLTAIGLRTEINATSPNVIGGNSGNFVTAGVFGATIGGGGEASFLNRVTDNFGTVGGGHNNQAGDNVGNTSDKSFATVGGGRDNIASSLESTIGGGRGNNASGERATVAGGLFNEATGISATVGGGSNNTASGNDSTVGGGFGNTASDFRAIVGGGRSNTASGNHSTVGGGQLNTASGMLAIVGGGASNTASGFASTVPGGNSNTAAGSFSFAAGRSAKAMHQGAFVWADSTPSDFASTANDQFLIRAAGGVGITGNLTASGSISVAGLRTEANATSPNVIGGIGNVTVGVIGATIGGGGQGFSSNRVTDNFGTVGGGQDNQAGDNAGTISDKTSATVGGGSSNTASGSFSTVGGGTENTASGSRSTVPGGSQNTAAGNGSFAAGRQAMASHHGTFVWADGSTGFTFISTADNQFLIQASGGVGIGTNAPADRLHVSGDIRVGTGMTGCVKDADGTVIAGSCSSDLRLKKQITPFTSLIDKLTRLRPVHFYWRADEYPEKHFGSTQSYGLIAQEVEQVLPELVGEDERGHKVVNYSKLPLMLLQAVKELKAENDVLKQRLDEMNKQKEELKQQQVQIEKLRKIICLSHPGAEGCK